MNSKEQLANSLVCLPDNVTISDFITRKQSIELFVDWSVPGRGKRICPHCGNSQCTIKDNSATQTIRHTPAGFRTVLLTFRKPRCKCPECGRSFYLHPDWAMPRVSVSMPLLVRIYKLLTSTTNNITEIARETGTTPSIVQNVMDHLSPGKPGDLPETLCIDEFHGDTGYYDKGTKRYKTEKYHCVIVDADAHAVMDVLEKPSYGVLKRYFMEYPLYKRRNVRFFCADMRSGFSKVARECFPKAKICIDPFHVTKLLTEAVSEVRITSWRDLKDKWNAALSEAKSSDDPVNKELLNIKAASMEKDYLLVKNSHRLLITSPYSETAYWNSHHKEADERKLRIFSICPDLKVPYDALMEFYDITETDTFSDKVLALDKWIQKLKDSDCPAVKKSRP